MCQAFVTLFPPGGCSGSPGDEPEERRSPRRGDGCCWPGFPLARDCSCFSWIILRKRGLDDESCAVRREGLGFPFPEGCGGFLFLSPRESVRLGCCCGSTQCLSDKKYKNKPQRSSRNKLNKSVLSSKWCQERRPRHCCLGQGQVGSAGSRNDLHPGLGAQHNPLSF